jgi:hypothetical protein
MKLNTAKTVLTSLMVGSTCILLFSGVTSVRVINTLNWLEGRDNNQLKLIVRAPINDTIVQAKPVVKQETHIRTEELIQAMIQVESGGNDSAFCARENAAGCLQIRPIMVKEVNRILKRTGSNIVYTLADRWSRKKSLEMFYVWRNYHHKTSNAEKIARNWNGGPNGYKMTATQRYWNKVQNEMK